MEFRILGPAELWSAYQQHPVGPARVQGVLAILLLTPRTIVPVDILIERLWDDRPPPKAKESLAVYMARLRASLRQAVGDSVRIAGRADGYMLDVDPQYVDLHQFRRLRRQANSLIASGDREHAALLLRNSDSLWRGQALAGIRGDWVARMRVSLEEERRAAIRQRVGCELDLGRHADLVGELHGLLAQYPLDEAFIAHQMIALYGSGRPADALSLYRETRRRLADEQGTDPGVALSDLHQRILRRDPDLEVEVVGRRAGKLPSADTLPPETVEFVGRGKELAGLASGDASDGPQVLVIEGSAGVGKSAFAAQAARMVADQYPGGVLYLNLHSYDPGSPSLNSGDAVSRLLGMMGIPAIQTPEGFEERVALWRAQLSRRRVVVILDDAGRQDQVEPLLPTAGRCLMLITTRVQLPAFDGASVLILDVLSAAEAVTLFTRIAGPGMTSDEEKISTAAQLCGRLPLAIQLTAGRLAQAHPPRLADLVDELSQSSARFGNPGEASPEVISAFHLSYRSLEPDHQRFLRRLGANPCPNVSLYSAAALSGDTAEEAEKALAALLNHRLLTREPSGQYRFHDLIRGFAASRADDDRPADRRQAVGRLLDYYLFTADRADHVLHPVRHRIAVSVATPHGGGPALGTDEDAAAWFNLEWRNILLAALHAGRHEWKRQCADLIHTLARYVEIRGHWAEAIAAHSLALQASREIADPARIAQAALELSMVSQHTGRGEAALALAEEAAEIYRTGADQQGLAEALDQIGLVNQRAGQSHKALAYFREARTLYERAADPHGMASALGHAGIACWHLGHYPDALSQLTAALSHYRAVMDPRGTAKTLNNLGKIQLHCGNHREALDCFQESLEVFTAIGGSQNQAILHQNIGSVHRYKGNTEMALAAYSRALAIYREIGDLPDETDLLNDIGETYQRAERYDEALIHFQQARLTAEELGNLADQVSALRGIADVSRGSGRYREALDRYQSALKLAKQIGDPYQEARILEGIAETALCTHKTHEARIVFRQTLDIYDRLGVPEAESTRIRLETMQPAICRRTLTNYHPGEDPVWTTVGLKRCVTSAKGLNQIDS